MAIVLTNDENYKAIANAIRGQTGEIDKLLPEQMAEEIDNIPNYAQSVVQEVSDARTGYNGTRYENLDSRIDGDINNLLDKTNTVNYKETTIHANNTYARNLVANRNKVEVLGQTIQNCLDHSSADKFTIFNGIIDENGYIVLTADGNAKLAFTKKESGVLKPNTTYTFIVDVKEYSIQTSSPTDVVMLFGETGQSSYQSCFTTAINFNNSNTKLKLGINKFVLQTKADLSSAITADRCYMQIFAKSGTIKFRYAIVEGDWTNKEISFVPFGLNYPKTTEVVECGKNLFNLEEFFKFGSLAQFVTIDGDKVSTTSVDGRMTTPMKFSEEPIDITLSGIIKQGTATNVRFDLLNNGQLVSSFYAGRDKASGKADSIRLNYTTTGSCEFENLQLELGTSATDYEPYTERKVNINKPLASISDTVRDRYYVKDGKKYHEQVIDILELNGDNLQMTSINVDTPTGYTRFPVGNIKGIKKQGFYNLKCDKLPISLAYGDTLGEVGISGSSENYHGLLYIRLKNEMLTSLNIAGIRKWLNENPLKILYELATPIVTEIQTEDMQSFDGQTNITTANAVKPTLDIDIPSDLTAVVSNLMVENTTLKQENQSLTSELENQKAVNEENTVLMNTILGGGING